MANTENINRLIELLKADDGSHFKMSMYVQYLPHVYDDREFGDSRYIECGTACCLAGWANTLSLADHGMNFKKLTGSAFYAGLEDSERAQAWLGLSDQMAEELFDAVVGFLIEGEFDSLSSDVRRKAGIRVLEILRDEDRVDWREALDEALAP